MRAICLCAKTYLVEGRVTTAIDGVDINLARQDELLNNLAVARTWCIRGKNEREGD